MSLPANRIASPSGGWFIVAPDGKLAIFEPHALLSLWSSLEARGYRVATMDDIERSNARVQS